MIIVRSPLRITLGGGGTDIPAYYEKYGGCCVAAAIDKYVYVTITRPFFKGIFLKYSELEHVDYINDVKHSRIREALRYYAHIQPQQIELTSLADIPAGTGLGSSSSFTTAVIKALCAYYGFHIDTRDLAEQACEIEIERLREPIGKQDQYISAFGGVYALHFDRAGKTRMDSIHDIVNLEEHLMLYFTGTTRFAADMLRPGMTKDSMGETAKALLEAGRLRDFGELLNVQWLRKKEAMPHTILPLIEEWREVGLKNGAIGGKLVGAGGGGFLLFYTEERSRLRAAMAKCGLEEVRFRFEFEGTKVLVS